MANKNYLLNDKFPKAIKNATSTSDGLMSSIDKSRLDSVFEYGLLSPATPDKDGIMAKEDKAKLDGIEENANYYVHPDNTNIRHVTDKEKETWNNQILYTNKKPTPSKVGGIEEGSTFENMDIKKVLDKLLYPYITPTISNINITPYNNIVLEKGDSTTITRFRFKINSKSINDDAILKYNIEAGFDNYTSIKQFTGTKNVDISANYLINGNTELRVVVTDTDNNKETTFSLGLYDFVYPYYYGVVDKDISITSSLVKSKSKLIQTSKTVNEIKYTTNNQKMLFAYPTDYHPLKSIYDANNFNIFNTFTCETINITGNDGKEVSYYVYYNDLSTVSDYNIKFSLN